MPKGLLSVLRRAARPELNPVLSYAGVSAFADLDLGRGDVGRRRRRRY